jgi:hypothetical protein
MIRNRQPETIRQRVRERRELVRLLSPRVFRRRRPYRVVRSGLVRREEVGRVVLDRRGNGL